MFFIYYIACFIVLIVAILLAIVSAFITIIIRGWKDKTAEISVLVGVATFFLVIGGVYGYWTYQSNDFYSYGGDSDYYRLPLDYPYELTRIDVTDCANISKRKENGLIVTGITHYHKRDHIIVGKISSECSLADKSAWFAFDTQTGKAIEYESEGEFDQALKELSFNEEPELLTIDENARLYWDTQ